MCLSSSQHEDETETAWAAGFFDGEGNAGFYRNGKTRRLVAQCSQTDRRVLNRFAAIVSEGTVLAVKGRGRTRPHFKWGVQSKGGFKRVFDLLAPYLSEVKRKQFQQAWDEHIIYRQGAHARHAAAGRRAAAVRWGAVA